MTTLVIAAHPDDETLGVGGTISRLTAQGEPVHVAIIGKSRVPNSHTAAALEHLGAYYAGTMALTDQRFDTRPLLDITRWIENKIRTLQPATVFTHAYDDTNEDHRIVHRAALPAVRPASGVRTVYAIEIPGSTLLHPTVYMDITATLDVKLEAMAMYETESREAPHPRSPEMLRALAQYRGSQADLNAAEAFHLIRQIQP